MPKLLENTEIVNAEIAVQEITGFSVDNKLNKLYISFDKQDINGNIIQEDTMYILEGEEMLLAISRASEIAGADVYAAIKQALYEALPGSGSLT